MRLSLLSAIFLGAILTVMGAEPVYADENLGMELSDCITDTGGGVQQCLTDILGDPPRQPVSCGRVGPMCAGKCPGLLNVCVSFFGGEKCVCAPTTLFCGPNPKTGVCGGFCRNPGAKCLATQEGCACIRPCGPDPFTGECGGVCPDPNDECLALEGDCTCVPPSEACRENLVTGVCGGLCPNPDDVCLATQEGCACVPPADACGPDPETGECGGFCPNPGDICVFDPFTGTGCDCVSSCGLNPLTRECGGPCPNPDDVCVARTGTVVPGEECACVPPGTGCTRAPDGTCICPSPGEVCMATQEGDCTCVQASCGLDTTQTPPVCAGECPNPGDVCLAVPDFAGGILALPGGGCACAPPDAGCQPIQFEGSIQVIPGLCSGLCPSPDESCVPQDSGCACFAG